MTSKWREPLILWTAGVLLRHLDKLENCAERNLLEMQQRQLQSSAPTSWSWASWRLLIRKQFGRWPVMLVDLKWHVSQQRTLVVGQPRVYRAILARVQPAVWGKWFFPNVGRCETKHGLFSPVLGSLVYEWHWHIEASLRKGHQDG